MSVSNDCTSAPGIRGAVWVSHDAEMESERLYPASIPVPTRLRSKVESKVSISPPRPPPGPLVMLMNLACWAPSSIVVPGGRPSMISWTSAGLTYPHTPGGSVAVPEPLSGTEQAAPPVGTQLSVVHGFPSSQLTGVYSHSPVTGLQRSSVQGFWSSQFTGACVQPPPPVAIRIVAVVLPDLPARGPPGAPTKSIRYVMSKKLSTAHVPPGNC